MIRQDPVRGEQDPDNPADTLHWQTVMAEKLAYEADRYPLVVI
ncbi:43780_t:CDS:2 [Gigaspora margarita]|uniref:43780_t:CDS:1 n=1 Tax=Gigaspora margarita TaxID=4874 RepID=A0ABN7V1Q7_GIGMA|nr:43780_t:CDS:2 [Gigaspora margarita]